MYGDAVCMVACMIMFTLMPLVMAMVVCMSLFTLISLVTDMNGVYEFVYTDAASGGHEWCV